MVQLSRPRGRPGPLESDQDTLLGAVIDPVDAAATRAQQKPAARSAEARERPGPEALSQNWREHAAAVLGDAAAIDAMVAAVLPGPNSSAPAKAAGGGPLMPSTRRSPPRSGMPSTA
ncbi:hypothetical protein Stsp01_65760 [Streptomyces sp. NBRC 13847]|nr:hypothetical protein Stsp01_65760 [Streptomyces sp. NBRC 13847]